MDYEPNMELVKTYQAASRDYESILRDMFPSMTGPAPHKSKIEWAEDDVLNLAQKAANLYARQQEQAVNGEYERH